MPSTFRSVTECWKSVGHRFLFILIVIQVFIGISLLLMAEYYKHLLAKYLPLGDDDNDDNGITTVNIRIIQLHGIHIVVVYFCALHSSSSSSHKQNARTIQLLLWSLFAIIVSIDGAALCWMWWRCSWEMEKYVTEMWYAGLQRYYHDAKWRLFWDAHQYAEQCCGVLSFNDWQMLLNNNGVDGETQALSV